MGSPLQRRRRRPAAFLFALRLLLSVCGAARARGGGDLRRVVEVPGEPGSLVWAVQLSDLHLSAFHPERAADFRRHVGDALAMVNPALVLITGDLTDAKSKDLLSSRQEEFEWIEYQRVIDDVANRSGLNKELFYDLRGNHDSYGVPEVGGMFDFYKKHSINAGLGRTGAVQSIALQNNGRKHLFVGFDSAMGVGLRSPTNIFGQPTDRLLSDLDAALSQWDNQSTGYPVTKIAFGHFPISFSALTTSGRSIRDVFLKHSLSAYLCGHLHTNFGRNLKRHHTSEQHRFSSSEQYFQFDIHEGMSTAVSSGNCSSRTESGAEFWEWEMGDWRSARSMRILAIDSGHVSYADMDFRFGSKDVIIVPTFPLDSRFMQRSSDPFDFTCQATSIAHIGTVRALVFSRNKIESVIVKVYDSHSGSFNLVLEQEMEKTSGKEVRGAMYAAAWKRDFSDASPDQYWFQIEAVDMNREVYLSERRPFSVNGLTAKISWTWKEFRVMGCQWNQLYFPIMWTTLAFLFPLVLVPCTSLGFYDIQFMLKFLRPKKTRRSSRAFTPVNFEFFRVELSKMYVIWSGMLLYLLYLVFFPWFTGYAVTENHNKMYFHYRGWSTKYLANSSSMPHIGLPDVMVIVLPHLLFVVLPAFLVIAAIAAERALYLGHDISLRAKKDDDHYKSWYTKYVSIFYWLRKILLLLCMPIIWKHWKHCRTIVRAYEVNPFLDAPVYCFGVPTLLWLAIYRSSSVGVYQIGAICNMERTIVSQLYTGR